MTDVPTPKCSAAPLQTFPWENILELRARAALNPELPKPHSRMGASTGQMAPRPRIHQEANRLRGSVLNSSLVYFTFGMKRVFRV